MRFVGILQASLVNRISEPNSTASKPKLKLYGTAEQRVADLCIFPHKSHRCRRHSPRALRLKLHRRPAHLKRHISNLRPRTLGLNVDGGFPIPAVLITATRGPLALAPKNRQAPPVRGLEAPARIDRLLAFSKQGEDLNQRKSF